MNVIAISGKASSGKDTMAEMLKDMVPGTQIFPFAEELKEIASRLWNLDPEYIKTYEGKCSLRSKLIQLGSSIRAIDPNTWIDIVVRKIQKSDAKFAVITDLRFLNELDRLVEVFKSDVALVRLTAPASIRMERMGTSLAKAYIDNGYHLDDSEVQFDFLEKNANLYDGQKMVDVQILQEYYDSVSNNYTTKEKFEKEVKKWLAKPVKDFDPVVVKNACYRLSRQLGPEAKLCL